MKKKIFFWEFDLPLSCRTMLERMFAYFYLFFGSILVWFLSSDAKIIFLKKMFAVELVNEKNDSS